MSFSDHDLFPSGRSVGNCRNDAKRKSRDQNISLTEAQNQVAIDNGGKISWAYSVENLVRQSWPREPTDLPGMSQADIRAVMDRCPELTRNGWGIAAQEVEKAGSYDAALRNGQTSLLRSVDECNRCLRFLQHVEKRKSINPKVGSSYGLKHEVERFLDLLKADAPANCYVANGSFICAALHLGFEVKRLTWNNPNVHFNMSSKSPVFEWRRLQSRIDSLSPQQWQRFETLTRSLGLKQTKRNPFSVS